MPKIHQLPLSEIQKIAAGEVVDRPANIVKELVENALDAGATKLVVRIEDGGKALIRVIDNGSGMDAIDARNCFGHHATSKLKSVNDLQQLATFGFRGEALSSIASVSRITLITKEESAQLGTKIALEASVITHESSVAANHGTDLTVRDLFFNIPARSKFLKTRDTEYRQILLLMQAIVLSYPLLHVEFYADDQLIFSCPAHESLVARAAQLWDYGVAQNLISVSNEDAKKGITVHGIISRQQYMRYDRSAIFLFANKRWVKNNHLMKALLKGYLNILPPARYPLAALFIDVDPLMVDINVHPRKEEVKFLHPQQVEGIIFHGVKAALEEQVSKPSTVPFEKHEAEDQQELYVPRYIAQDFNAAPRRYEQPMQVAKTLRHEYQEAQDVAAPEKDCSQESGANTLCCAQSTVQPTIAESEEIKSLASSPAAAEQQITLIDDSAEQVEQYAIIGQYQKTYILLEQAHKLIVIDQHAAHERILYEHFKNRFAEIAVVKLLFPLLMTVSRDDATLAELHGSLFESHGLSIDRFGETQLRILATPVHLQERLPQEVVLQIIGWLREYGSVATESLYDLLNEKIRAKMACVAAVKAGDALTMAQMESLIRDLYVTENRITCPHGRPTTWQLELAEIEKKFKRDYRDGRRPDLSDC